MNRIPDFPTRSLLTTENLVQWQLKTAGKDDIIETEAFREQEVQDAWKNLLTLSGIESLIFHLVVYSPLKTAGKDDIIETEAFREREV